MFIINYSKNVKRESNKIKWLSFTQVVKETTAVIIAAIIFALFLSGVNWLLQQSLIHLLAR
ncbi:preprotein translocase subunit SecE [Lactococcus sp. S64]|uniref:preprotein translocase subunit SecE n=1 Tax=Lactococcus sp. S64 TaxID=2767459 RepID=UPI001F416FA6|nr:preprotein translocase subunit SecE [Lactococcus sp. S64]